MTLYEDHKLPMHFEWIHRADRGRHPVVLLHGLGSCGEDWFPQFAALSSDWSVLTLDFPGHGASPPAANTFSIATLADSVARLLIKQSDEPFHLVGLSLGAVVGLQMLVDYPKRLRSAMLVNGFARFRPGRREGLGAIMRLLFLLMGRMDWVGRWVARSVFPEPDQCQYRQLAADRIASVDRRTYWNYLRAVGRFDLVDSLQAIDKPVLVVAGLADRVVAREAKAELAADIPGARYETFPESGHGTPIDSHQAFNALMVEWLRANANTDL